MSTILKGMNVFMPEITKLMEFCSKSSIWGCRETVLKLSSKKRKPARPQKPRRLQKIKELLYEACENREITIEMHEEACCFFEKMESKRDHDELIDAVMTFKLGEDLNKLKKSESEAA
jgi:hypothetical protein